MKAEHAMQPLFTIIAVLQALTLAALVGCFALVLHRQPDREELGWRWGSVHLQPVALDSAATGDARLVGAWQASSNDPRFGGVSALAVAGNDLVGLTDSGAVARFAKPGRGTDRALIGDLPGGPGDPRFKLNRDSEALARDPAGRGWWVAFENRNELWLYDNAFRRELLRIPLGRDRFPRNFGIEGMVAGPDELLLTPENGRSVMALRKGRAHPSPIRNQPRRISDSTRLPAGQLVVLTRSMTPVGFVNAIGMLTAERGRYRYRRIAALPVGRLDNMEALAPEPLPGGGTRLWLMSDDNHQRPFRTLLLALDIPATQQAARRPSW
jgi:hypothetical protein